MGALFQEGEHRKFYLSTDHNVTWWPPYLNCCRLLPPVSPGASQLWKHWIWHPLLLCGLVRVWGFHPWQMNGNPSWSHRKLILSGSLFSPAFGAVNWTTKTMSRPSWTQGSASCWTLDMSDNICLKFSLPAWTPWGPFVFPLLVYVWLGSAHPGDDHGGYSLTQSNDHML